MRLPVKKPYEMAKGFDIAVEGWKEPGPTGPTNAPGSTVPSGTKK